LGGIEALAQSIGEAVRERVVVEDSTLLELIDSPGTK
jgi:hypothetical protein